MGKKKTETEKPIYLPDWIRDRALASKSDWDSLKPEMRQMIYREISDKTGVPLHVLYSVAGEESFGGKSTAKNPDSTAYGIGQFTRGTWGMRQWVRRHVVLISKKQHRDNN